MSESSKWRVVFYRDPQSRLPVDAWVRGLSEQDQTRIFKTIGLLASYGVQLSMPHARHLRGKMWELRIAAGRQDYRILYAAVVGRKFVLLHGFSKKTAKTPLGELEIAERRLADYLAQSREV